MRHSDTLAKIAPALVAALGKIEGAAKKKANPAFKGTKYADLETVIDGSRDILTEHGLTIIQLPGACVSGVMNLETILMHESGEWISGEMGIALGKTDPQGVGSALTYARRYAQMAALNMPAVDDDAEHAMGRGEKAPSKASLKRSGIFETLRDELDQTGSINDLEAWGVRRREDIHALPQDWCDAIRDRFRVHREGLAAKELGGEMDENFRGTVGPASSESLAGRPRHMAAE